eukprot:scaffold122556_cov34-Prasinocladus_malaysianus.AAC.2
MEVWLYSMVFKPFGVAFEVAFSSSIMSLISILTGSLLASRSMSMLRQYIKLPDSVCPEPIMWQLARGYADGYLTLLRHVRGLSISKGLAGSVGSLDSQSLARVADDWSGAQTFCAGLGGPAATDHNDSGRWRAEPAAPAGRPHRTQRGRVAQVLRPGGPRGGQISDRLPRHADELRAAVPAEVCPYGPRHHRYHQVCD